MQAINQRNKKRTILVLLFISCIASAWLLFDRKTTGDKQLKSFAEADSLIRLNFRRFHIDTSQINQIYHHVDSSFVRIEYHVRVPPWFSKTQFHAALHRDFYEYGIGTPARLDLRDHSMYIYVYFNETIIRTIDLYQDTVSRKRFPPKVPNQP